MSVLDEIRAERAKQVRKGYNAKHDDEHDDGSIAVQAAALADNNHEPHRDLWGLALDHKHRRREQLIIAAALLVAEIERLDRAGRKVVVTITREQVPPRSVKRYRRASPWVYHLNGVLSLNFPTLPAAKKHARERWPGCSFVLAWRSA